MKKKFKETKFGKLVIEKIPHVADLVGDLLPDQGVLGIVKNLISSSDLSPEEKAQLLQQEKEFFELEIRDRESARLREAEYVKAHRFDFLMGVVGVVILSAFGSVVYASIWMKIGGESFVQLKAMIENMMMAIVFYYFGASKGGRAAAIKGSSN